jgi:hypothetical protein
MNTFEKLSEHKLVVALTVFGGLIFTLWEPFTNIFYTGYFHKNVQLEVQTENIEIDKKNQLLVVHIIPSNKGNVPINIKGKDDFSIEVRRVKNFDNFNWVNKEKLEIISKINISKNQTEGSEDFYTLEPNAAIDAIEAIPLPKGTYCINATLKYSGGSVNQSQIVQLSANKREK